MASLDFTTEYAPNEIFSVGEKCIKFDTKQDIEPYLKKLNQLKVKKIDFSGNTIGTEASEALAQSLVLHKDTLEEVNFADLFTGRLKDEIPVSLEHLLPPLTKSPNLKIINLSDNAFGLSTIDPVEDFLTKAVYMEHLILSNNGMGPFCGQRIGKALFKLSLEKQKLGLPSLKTFICGRNRLENGSSSHLAIGLKAHKDLQVVKLYQNGIRPEGIAKLINDGFKYNEKLTILDLQDNTITKRSSKDLAHGLKFWKDLKELNINDCLLNPAGSLDLVKALNGGDVLERLEVLKLQYNELDQPAFDILVEAIAKKLPKLKSLELNGNRLEEDACTAITDIFEERGFGELDELDDLEEVDSDEEEESEDDEEAEDEDEYDEKVNKYMGVPGEVLEKELLKEYAASADKEVDDLASKIEKVNI